MRKWRPTYKCIYVISDIFGDSDSLEIILNRILPLRKFVNQEDVVVFLGNYINYNDNSNKVLDILINIKNHYPNRSFFLKGPNEQLLINAINGSNEDYSFWLNIGGSNTLNGYIKEKNIFSNPLSITRQRITDLIKKDHIDFLFSLEENVIYENYVFFHGSFDHLKSINDNSKQNFIFDFTASRYVKECVLNKKIPEFKDNYIYVGSNNFKSKKPYIHSKYFMLGGLGVKKILVMELNSMTACMVKSGKTRIYKYDLNFID